ncbi:MAG TPA: hypothetical protein PKC91_02025 [Ignavibacteria bacterium]|nr:hypothetical protein [Ignavibacteria bacterium]
MTDKKIFFVIILFLFLSVFTENLISDQSVNETELFVIGTVHESTEAFNSDTLLNILNEISPDVILIESDSSYFTSGFKLNDDIREAFLETKAVTEYLKIKSTELRPYDISGRDEFLDDPKRISTESDFFSEIASLNEKGSFNNEAAGIFTKISAMINTANEMSFEKASYINSSEGSLKIDTINYYTYEGLSSLISLTPELKSYGNYWKEECTFWEKRNKVMTENIFKYLKQFTGKRIVVLCGFAHKNILINDIDKGKNKKIVLKDFWNK